jgi:hypothetical protein
MQQRNRSQKHIFHEKEVIAYRLEKKYNQSMKEMKPKPKYHPI